MKLRHLPLAIGVVLRLTLLAFALPVTGHYGGDALRYIEMANGILSGNFSTSIFWYPPGYPALVAVFLCLFKTLWPLALANIVVYIWFSIWLPKRLVSIMNPFWIQAILWFLALDPVWLSQTPMIGADFLSTICFGVVLVLLMEKQLDAKKAAGLGLLFAFAIFLKTVYLWIPLLILGLIWKKNVPRLALVFLLATYAPVALYSAVRKAQTGSAHISGHDSSLFGKYIVGYIYLAQGKTTDLYAAMDMASAQMLVSQMSEQGLQWNEFTKRNIYENKGTFLKLFFGSFFKTVFGNANVNITYFFTGKEIQGPGMWNNLFQGRGLENIFQLKVVFWLIGMLFSLLEKLALMGAALWGFWKWCRRDAVTAVSLLLMVGYFAFTPIVFGEPRYFLPGTFVALILASRGFLENT